MTNSRSVHQAGHLFIINGDITRLKCDAVLVPTDQDYFVTEAFARLVGLGRAGELPRNADASWSPTAVSLLRRGTKEAPDLWIGNLGGNESTSIRQFVRCAENFVLSASERLNIVDERDTPHSIALPVVGSGEGGGATRRGRILKQLVPALIRLAHLKRVDIILVTWGRVTFEAAQSVRKDYLRRNPTYATELGPELSATAARLSEEAKGGNLVVFVGAGVSATAGLPAWQRLLDDVAKRLGYKPVDIARLHELDVRDQASLLARKRSFKSKVNLVLGAGNYSLVHGLLASLPVKEFATTNFDELLEAAAAGPGNRLTVLPGEALTTGGRWLVKLHGTIGRDLILTRSEYRDARNQHGALFGLLQALLITRHMLFVGYSLQDEDFNDVMHDVRLVHQRTPNDRRRCLGTVVTAFENPEFSKLWPDLEVQPLAPPRPVVDGQLARASEAEWGSVGRTLALLLDRVALESASDVAYLSDSTMKGVASDGPKALTKALARLGRAYAEFSDEPGADSGRWAKVRAALDSLAAAAEERHDQTKTR